MAREIIPVANAIVNSKFKFTDIQHRLLWHLVAQIEREDDDFKVYNYHVTELLDVLRMGRNNGWQLGEVLDKATDAKIFIRDGHGGWIKIHWFTKTVFNYQLGTLDLKLNSEIKPLLLELKEKFTKLSVKAMQNLTGNNSRHLYMIAKQQYELVKQGYPQNRVIYLEIAKLREEMMLEDSYPMYNDFMRYVIYPAVADINKNSDIRVVIVPDDTTRIRRKYTRLIMAVDTPDGDFKRANMSTLPVEQAKKYRTPTKITPEVAETKRNRITAKMNKHAARKFAALDDSERTEFIANINILPFEKSITEQIIIREYKIKLLDNGDKVLKRLEKQLAAVYDMEDILNPKNPGTAAKPTAAEQPSR